MLAKTLRRDILWLRIVDYDDDDDDNVDVLPPYLSGHRSSVPSARQLNALPFVVYYFVFVAQRTMFILIEFILLILYEQFPKLRRHLLSLYWRNHIEIYEYLHGNLNSIDLSIILILLLPFNIWFNVNLLSNDPAI